MKISKSVYLIGSGHYGISHSFDCSVYLVDAGDTFLMIDSGCGVNFDRIVGNIQSHQIDPRSVSWLLLTHVHADHAGGAFLMKKLYATQVAISETEKSALEKGSDDDLGLSIAKKSGFYDANYSFKNCTCDKTLGDGEEMKIGRLTIKVIQTRGHSEGSLCYFVELPEGKALFCGDYIFPEGCIGLLNMKGSSLEDYRKSIERLKGLGINLLFPGHKVFLLSEGQNAVALVEESLGRLGVPRNFI